MKLPPSILVCGVTYKLRQDPNSAGGSFDTEKAEIVIGTRVKHDIPDTFMHEVVELVYTVRNMRFTKQVAEPDNGDYLFCFNHEDHHRATADITAALKGIKF